MIKLESAVGALGAHAVITVQSHGSEPSLVLSTDKVRKQVNGEWQDDPARLRQSLVFVGEDGPCELSGLVTEPEAVEMPSAWRVVAIATLSTKSLPAYQAGRISRSLVALELVKVVEVWTGPDKCLWRAQDWQKGLNAGGKVFDAATGKVRAA